MRKIKVMFIRFISFLLIFVISSLSVEFDFHTENLQKTSSFVATSIEQNNISDSGAHSNLPNAEMPLQHICHIGHIGHCQCLNPFIIVFTNTVITFEYGFTPNSIHSFVFQKIIIKPPIS